MALTPCTLEDIATFGGIIGPDRSGTFAHTNTRRQILYDIVCVLLPILPADRMYQYEKTSEAPRITLRAIEPTRPKEAPELLLVANKTDIYFLIDNAYTIIVDEHIKYGDITDTKILNIAEYLGTPYDGEHW